MVSRFFIERPVLSSVLSIIIVLAGLAAMRGLPVAQYPNVVPPQVVVSANYPGASAEAVADAVAAPLESAINGVENMLYMTTSTYDSGDMTLKITFAVGTDPNQAAIDVTNEMESALSRLPEEVRTGGVSVSKESNALLKIIALNSPDGSRDPIFLNNYALMTIQDEIQRVPGVGSATMFGSKTYAIRVWLRPDKMAEYDLTPADVDAAINEQNAQFAAGQFGAAPNPNNPQEFTLTVATDGRFSSVEEFEQIILKARGDGSMVRLNDIARVELGALRYNFDALHNQSASVPIGIYLRPGANALETSQLVDDAVARMAANFPSGVSHSVPFDTTEFVKVSISQVVQTLLEAILLVVGVVYLFLQRFRATIIPLIAVPVSLIGAMAGMYLFGFSINMLTLLAMVLAIGIVVDDAIVVLENVERIMREEKLPPKQAAIKAMEEVSGPVIAIVLVLSAVFIPVAFIGGLAGIMYQQFAITIAISVIISGIVALTLTPALCALLLSEKHTAPPRFLQKFNQWFDNITNKYTVGVQFMLKRTALGVSLFIGLIIIASLLVWRLPGGLVPDEDQGYVMAAHYLPDGASFERNDAFVERLNKRLSDEPLVDQAMSFTGFDLIAGGLKSNAGASFITMKHWDTRDLDVDSSFALAERISAISNEYPEGSVTAFNPPPIQGISTTGGFEGYLVNTQGASAQELYTLATEIAQKANQHELLQGVRTTLNTNIPRYKAEVDRERAKSMGVSINEIFAAMKSTFGASYVNDFNLFGRVWRVYMQAESEFRSSPDDLAKVFVRAEGGEMVPLDSVVTVTRTTGPDIVDRYNNYPAAKIMGNPATGVSSGEALLALEQIVTEVTDNDPYTQLFWVGSAYQEKTTGAAAQLAFVFGIVVVFLILAAQYERWSLPLAVITAVPFAVFGAAIAVTFAGMQNDVYFQIGILVLIGLAAKNAILIVEFAVLEREQGRTVMEAAMNAARLRFRPIVMTSLAFILGAVPLMLSSGAGSAARNAVGTTVVGGMLAATFIAIFFIPLFYRLIDRRSKQQELAHEK